MPTPHRKFDRQLCYHVYNCGVEKRTTFILPCDYQRFLGVVSYYLYDQPIPYSQFINNSPAAQREYLVGQTNITKIPRVYVLAYCLMPNHFHFILKQESELGIRRFLSDVANSYTKYFNIRNKRGGYLFQGNFKAKEVDSQESLLQVSRYIHLNPVMSARVRWSKSPELYPYSSHNNWLKGESDEIVSIDQLKKFVNLDPGNYQNFVAAKVPEDYSTSTFSELLLDSN